MNGIYRRLFGFLGQAEESRVWASLDLHPELFAWQVGGVTNSTLAVNICPQYPLSQTEMDELFSVLARTQMVTDGTKCGNDILELTNSMQRTLGRQRMGAAYPTVTDLSSYLVFVDTIVAGGIDTGRYLPETALCTDGASFTANVSAFATNFVAAINAAGQRP